MKLWSESGKMNLIDDYLSSNAFRYVEHNALKNNKIFSPVTNQSEMFDAVFWLGICHKLPELKHINKIARQHVYDELNSIKDECIFNGYNWRRKKNSGFCAALLFEQISSIDMVAQTQLRDMWQDIAKMYENLRVSNEDYFLHDTEVEINRFTPRVLNIGAFYANHLALGVQLGFVDKSYNEKIRNIVNAISVEMRPDGYFPYIASGNLQKKLLRYSPSLLKNRIYKKVLGDHNIDFIDMSHQLYITVLIDRIRVKTDDDELREMCDNIVNASLTRVCIQIDEGTLFNVEPELHLPRFCNFGDTNTYFLLAEVFNRRQPELLKTTLSLISSQKLDKHNLYFRPVRKEHNSVVLPAIWMSDSWKLNQYLTMLN